MEPESETQQSIHKKKLTISAAFTIVFIVFTSFLVFRRSPTPQPTIPITTPITVQEPTDVTNWKTYINEEYGFQINFPNNLIINDKFIGPDPTGSDQTIQISNVEVPFGLVCYYENGVDPCRENIAVYISVRNLASNNETLQQLISYSDPNPDIQKIVKINNLSFISVGKSSTHYAIEKNNIAYSFTFMTGEGIKDKAIKTYNQILSTFKFSDEDSVTTKECIISGCNNEICSDQNLFSACIILPQHACFRTATCERQLNGQCGWTQTEELTNCLAKFR